MLIAIDHGNKQCKLVRSEPFISGLSESEVRPFGTDVLKYQEKYYQISDQRIPYRRGKTEDDRFFILSLFGIANEIEAAGAYIPDAMRVQLAVGLPRHTTEHRTPNLPGTFPGAALSASCTAINPTSSASTMWPASRSPMPRRPPCFRLSPPFPWHWWLTLGVTQWTTSESKRAGAIWHPAIPWRTGLSCSITRLSPRSGRRRISSCLRRRLTPSC